MGQVSLGQREGVGQADIPVKLHPLAEELPGGDNRRARHHRGQRVVGRRQVDHPALHHSLTQTYGSLGKIWKSKNILTVFRIQNSYR